MISLLRKFLLRRAQEWVPTERLIHWGQGNYWTVGLSFEGSHATGVSGSGKSSGMVAFQASAMMEAGFGMAISTVKEVPSDVDFFREIAEKSGRANSVVLIGPGQNLGCNVLKLEMEAALSEGAGGDLAANVAGLISSVLRLGGNGVGDESIWPSAGEDLLRHVVTVVYLATENLVLDDIADVMASLPQSITQSNDKTWQRESACWRFLEMASARHPANRNLALAKDGLTHQFPLFPPDTRNSILFTVNAGGVNLLRRDPLYSMFFSNTDYTPEILREGAIIICACPILKFQETGRLANCLFRIMVQRWLGRQGQRSDCRPVGMIFDECQKSLTRADIDFQETARSTRTATVAATLTLPTLIEKVGEDSALSFLSYLRTQAFFQSADRLTGEYMSHRCGKITETKESTTQGQDGKKNITKYQEEVDALPAHAAGNLKTGGLQYDNLVEAFLTIGGRKLRGGLPYVKVRFDQRKFRNWLPGRVSVVARRRPAPDFRYLREY